MVAPKRPAVRGWGDGVSCPAGGGMTPCMPGPGRKGWGLHTGKMQAAGGGVGTPGIGAPLQWCVESAPSRNVVLGDVEGGGGWGGPLGARTHTTRCPCTPPQLCRAGGTYVESALCCVP